MCTVPPPFFCHVPDWHWPPCQSGVWRTSGSSNGSYSNLGSHRGSFTGRNTGS
ncbi:prepilin, shufflon protein A, partial [Escherichia coli]